MELCRGVNDTWNSYQRANKGRTVTTAEWKSARSLLWSEHEKIMSSAESSPVSSDDGFLDDDQGQYLPGPGMKREYAQVRDYSARDYHDHQTRDYHDYQARDGYHDCQARDSQARDYHAPPPDLFVDAFEDSFDHLAKRQKMPGDWEHGEYTYDLFDDYSDNFIIVTPDEGLC